MSSINSSSDRGAVQGVDALIPFSGRYSIGMYATLLEIGSKHPADASGRTVFSGPEYEAWKEQFHKASGWLDEAIWVHMHALSAAGRLSKVPHSEGRGHRFADAWNRLVDGPTAPWDRDSIVDRLSRSATMPAFGKAPADPAEATARVERLYAQVVQRMDRGDFDEFDIGCDDECRVTGDRLRVQIANWTPQLGTIARHQRQYEFVPITTGIPAPQVEHHVFDAPSGELLIADWFRITHFTAAVESAREQSKLRMDVNSNAGKLAQTRFDAAENGFASFFVGNTLPRVVDRCINGIEGHFAVARVDEDQTQTPLVGNVLGSVCTDLWWTTIIDREVLVATTMKGGRFRGKDYAPLSREDAKKMVDDYVAEQVGSGDVTVLRVRPGSKLHLYHTADPYAMQQFREVNGAVSTDAIEQMYAVISATPLAWEPKAAPAAAPAAEPAPARRRKP